jgi:cyclopropane fatty-acyl-phospholipid synthase-like methyltransferase
MRFDRLTFGLFYRVGFTPWEGHALPVRLRELVEGPAALPTGQALDIGCGTGDTSVYLARHGWTVTAVDFVKVAVERARMKAAAAGVHVRTMQADVTRLASYDVGSGFQLMVDNGCLHGLSDEGRGAYVRQVSAIALPGATLLLAGFSERDRRGPRGFDRPEVERRFASGWELLGSREDPAISKRPGDPIYVYELRRK